MTIGIDDANIYFVYIKNFVNEGQFVYNTGGERVEGFTSMLWVLIGSLLYLITGYIEVPLLFLNILLVTFILHFSIKTLNRINNKPNYYNFISIAYLSVLFLVPGFLDWMLLPLMEGPLWGFLIAWVLYIFIKSIYSKTEINAYLISLLFVCLLLTRPESLLIVPLLILLVFVNYFWLRNISLKQSFLKTRLYIIVYAVATLGITIFRILYFGYPLPNTFYAKVSTSFLDNVYQGTLYVLRGSQQYPIIWIVIASVVIAISCFLSFNKKSVISLNAKVHYLMVFFAFILLLIPILEGGDHFKLYRFYQPVMPIFLLIVFNKTFYSQSFNLRIKIPILQRYLILIMLIPFLYLQGPVALHDYVEQKSLMYGEYEIAETGRLEGQYYNALFDDTNLEPSIGVSAAGGIAYTYHNTIEDLMGLNNTQMAHAIKEKHGMKNHAAFHPETFYQIEPDIFHGYKKTSYFTDDINDTTLIIHQPDFNKEHVFRLFKGIFKNDQFFDNYIPVMIMKDDMKIYLKTFISKKFYYKLRSNPRFSVQILN